MLKTQEHIKDILDGIISDMSSNVSNYAKNPDKDFTRDRKLPFEKVVKIILSMKGNTLNKELYDFFGRTPDNIVTSSAFVQQRDKLADNVFEDIFHRFNETMTDVRTYRGYQLYAVDGSDINIAYDKDADTYWEPSKGGKGVNQYHLNAIYDLLNKVYVDANLTPRPKWNERKDFIDMLEQMDLNTKTLFIADRGYPSWNVFAHFKHKNNADYLIRVRNAENTLVRELPMMELDVDRKLTITTNRKYKDTNGYKFIPKRKGTQNRVYTEKPSPAEVQWDFGEFEELNFRIVRFKITNDDYETIFTSLPRDKFSIQDIKELYAMRWGIETSFRELKYVIGLTNLHSKKDGFIRQEIFAKLTMYNFCERIISVAVVEQDAGRKHKYQINYTMGMQICLDFYRALVKSDDVYSLILKYIEAVREGRRDKRKLKPKTFVYFAYRVAA